MALEKTTGLHELLIRFDPSGSVRGSHRIDLERVVNTDTGEVFAEKMLPAQAVAADDLAGLVGAQAAAMIEQIGALQARVDGDTAARETAEDAAEQAMARATAAEASAREWFDKANSLAAEIKALQDKIAASEPVK